MADRDHKPAVPLHEGVEKAESKPVRDTRPPPPPPPPVKQDNIPPSPKKD